MSRLAPFIPVDLNRRQVLVESLTSRLPRCDCCPGLCITCDEESRPLLSFSDTSRLINANGETIQNFGTTGPWEPVACWDGEGPIPRLFNILILVPEPAGLFGEESFLDACLINHGNLPSGPFPLSTCRVYFWQDRSGLGDPSLEPTWIAAVEVFSGNPFDPDAVPIGWYVVEQFEFPGAAFSRAWGFTSDPNWPFTLSPVTLLGCEVPAVIGFPPPNIRELVLGR